MNVVIYGWKPLIPLKGREVLQENLDKLEGSSITSHIKFSTSKCQILYLGWCNLGYRLGDKQLDCNPAERNPSVLTDVGFDMANSVWFDGKQQYDLEAKRTNYILGYS